MKIAVLGGGNGSFAAVCDFLEGGHEVAWWRRKGAQGLHSVSVTDHAGTREVAITPTADLAEALRGAALIFAPTPAFAQADIAERLAPHLADGQVVYLAPGSFGSVMMARIVAAAGSTAEVAWAETGTLPWLARKQGADGVRITTRASRLPTGVYPARLTDRAIGVIASAFPDASIEPLEDALSGALMNAGPIIHPPLILMNAGPIEHFDRWDIHNEGTQPSVRKVHDRLDAERIAVREALGYGAPHFPLRDHYETDQWMYGNLAHDKLVGSGDWHEKLDLTDHRYVTEDIEVGLAFLVSVGAWVGVPTPVATGLLALASAINDRDMRAGPRTMEGLGLAQETTGAVQASLREGFR